MKHCAQHPVNEEFSLCGNAEDEQTPDNEFTFVVSGKPDWGIACGSSRKSIKCTLNPGG